MAYRCPQAITGGAREAIRCKVSGSVCAHQKMCMMEGRIVLTDGAMRCPGRDAEMMPEDDLDLIPEDEPEVMLTDVEILPAGYTGPAAKSGKAEDLPVPETVQAADPEPAPAAAAEPEKKPGRKAARAKKSSGKK